MPKDDLAPDAVLVMRMEQAADHLTEVIGVMKARPHLPCDELAELTSRLYELVGEANAASHPEDEINAKYLRGKFLTTSTGIRFYPFTPRAEEVQHLDIVVALASINRYNGHTSRPSNMAIPRPISVGEHSIKTAAIAEVLCERDGLSMELKNLAALFSLFHDAHEAYLGDTIRPVKERLYDGLTGQPLSALEQGVQDAINAAYALPPIPAEIYSIVKEADLAAYVCEVTTIRRQSLEDDNDPLPPVSAEVLAVGRINPKTPPLEDVARLLDSEMRRLVQIAGGMIPGPYAPPLDVAESTLSQEEALKRLNDLKQVPGERPYAHAGPEPKDTGFVAPLSRAPRSDDVSASSASSWQDAATHPAIPTPEKLIAEMRKEMADPETPELKRQILKEDIQRMQELSGS